MLRQYPTQMFNQTCHCLKIKRSVMDAEMPRYIKCCSSISANPRSPAWGAIVQSGRGINGRALVLFSHPPRQVLHSPSDLVPAKWGSASIALLNFHPSSWMISPVVSRRRTGGGCFFFFLFSFFFSFLFFFLHRLSGLPPHLKGVFPKCD